MEKIILGIDPGTNLMGYGVLKVLDNKAQMITMGVIDLRKFSDAYMKLGHIYERVTGIIDSYLPDEMAIEAPFFGKNVQSMLKLGRAQGTARRTHTRVCTDEDKDGHHGPGAGLEGASGGNAAAHTQD